MQLAVIAKEPLPGRVKTRLSPPFTPDEAAALAQASLADTLATVARTPAVRRVLVLEGEPGPWLPDGFDVIAQRGEGLAERLAAAFEDCTASCHEPVVLVGMDTPQLTVEHLVRAGARLARGDDRDRPRAVLGPAVDGGYWLIGLSTAEAGLFEGVPMSESTTCSAQMRQLRDHGFAMSVLDELVDIDTAEDAASVAELAPGSRFAECFQRIADALAASR